MTKTICVEWGDMDASQHVNNSVYFKWIESIRIDFLMDMNMSTSFKEERSIGAVVAWQDCKYIRPVVFPDKVKLEVRRSDILAEKIVLETRIFSENRNEIVAISKQHIVPYDYVHRRKLPLPTHWIDF